MSFSANPAERVIGGVSRHVFGSELFCYEFQIQAR
jgi:hypothetical protein